MCGLVGVAGQLGKKEEDAIKQLLIVDSLRGTDSTGIAVVPRTNGDVKIAKQIGNPFDLFDTNSYTKAMQSVNRVVIGHNRYSTVGSSSRKNAHPFEFDTLVGAHNGTLTNKWQFVDGHLFDVDSQAIYNHIEKKGLRDAINTAKGAYALIWWDKEEETINFLRNKERPLWMIFSTDGRAMFWASELWMLEGVLSRNQIVAADPYFLDSDVHMSIVVGKDGSLSKPVATPMAQPVIQGYAPYTHTPPQTQSSFQQAAQKLVNDSKKASHGDNVVDLCAAREQIKQELPIDYMPIGHITLTILSVNRDGFGARYFLCQDAAEPKAEIRLFFNNSLPFDPELAIGGSVIGVVNPKPNILKNIKFWKVQHNSINWRDLEYEEPVSEAKIKDHHGHDISEDDFIKKYSECCWCSGFVNPLFKYSLTSEGQAICHDCMEVEDIQKYVNVAVVKD